MELHKENLKFGLLFFTKNRPVYEVKVEQKSCSTIDLSGARSTQIGIKMIILNTDLDNTIIYSYKHNIGDKKRNVETYQGREISFITEESFELLHRVKEHCIIVPTTTRTREQYERINLGIGTIEYALVCNGGILLHNGEEDERWYKQTQEEIKDCKIEMIKAEQIMEQDINRNFEVRNIRELFLFTKSEKPEKSVGILKERLNLKKVDVYQNGVKVYVVPKNLNKGRAISRFKAKLKKEQGITPIKLIAAGDSEFDISMLNTADIGFAPYELSLSLKSNSHIKYMNAQENFTEQFLKNILNIIDTL